MRNLLLAIAFIVLALSCSKSVSAQQSNSPKIDSVLFYHFMVLDSAYAENKRYADDSTYLHKSLEGKYDYIASINFMEKLTGVFAEVEENYFANKKLTKKKIAEWKNWTLSHKNILQWESNKYRVNRKDIDIYTGMLLPK